MKGILDRNRRLFIRSLWIIKLRWLAVVSVILAVVIIKYLYNVRLTDFPIYIVCFFLVVENLISLKILGRINNNKTVSDDEKLNKEKIKSNFIKIKRINNFQIFFDLIALTIILYFTGGVENPFIFFYFFHLAIASVLLSPKETLFHSSFAVILFLALVYSSYFEFVPYQSLHIEQEFADMQLYLNSFYVIKRTVSFMVTLFILVFLVSSIGLRLQNQEEKYSKALNQLEKQDNIKNEYVLRVTHDIKGHLAAIQSNLSVITSRILGPLEDKYAGFIDRAHKRTFIATHFIRDLLKLTRLRIYSDSKFQNFQIKEVLEKALNHTKTNAEAKSISLLYDIDENIGEGFGNEFSIQEITGNIILNAIKYTSENGTIKLIAKNYDHFVKISIEDTGVGIPEDEISLIFDEFYRASNVKKVVEDGTGIGLTIVKKVIEEHGGKIWVESELGEGSVFIFTLPKILPDNKQAK